MKHTFKNSDKAIDTIIEASKKHSQATEAGDYKTANKNYHYINDAIIYLLENDNVKELRKLLTYDEISVKVWVASYLIKQDDLDALIVLKEIASKSIRHHSSSAKILLQQWEAKKLKQ